mmetsp:Transcript_92730/g.178005  ORF Transcript_92730/g.178005 Transcript_92730/m.178005 type:complete len:204 (+) Transcript_92730:83-694(+)
MAPEACRPRWELERRRLCRRGHGEPRDMLRAHVPKGGRLPGSRVRLVRRSSLLRPGWSSFPRNARGLERSRPTTSVFLLHLQPGCSAVALRAGSESRHLRHQWHNVPAHGLSQRVSSHRSRAHFPWLASRCHRCYRVDSPSHCSLHGPPQRFLAVDAKWHRTATEESEGLCARRSLQRRLVARGHRFVWSASRKSCRTHFCGR